MRTAILCILILTAASLIASAQIEKRHSGHGYVFFAPGTTSPGGCGTFHYGGGAEGLVYKGLGAGAEIGYIHPTKNFGCGLGVFSANGSYHFGNYRSGGVVTPFVTGGYSLLFRSRTANAFNVGGGVTYWFRRGIGLRFEFRDHVWPEEGEVGHLIGFRVGLAFR